MRAFPPFILLALAFLLLGSSQASGQTAPAKPKLIVGIVVDQMRYDFLYRYESKYGPNGFKRLLREGFSCENTHYNYMPTFTGPGHAAIYTGAVPAVNGIIANEWWDPEWSKHRYVTTDTTVIGVGAVGKVGQHSPRVLLSSTVTDELRLSNNFRSKVVGVCLKDRASILPAGHFPNAAYWFDDKTGNWITSSYYTDSLPDWVTEFNARRLADQYMARPWGKLSGVSYDESFKNWDQFEDAKYFPYFPDSMPYDLAALKKRTGNYAALRFAPVGNAFTVDFALESIGQMGLGQDEHPDLLCVSFSSPDYCAHQFGIHAEETQDVYLRLDAEVARILDFLDKKFGRENVLVFLTADHGGAETPAHLNTLSMPAGVFPESKADSILERALSQAFGRPGNYVHEVANQQVWLNHTELRAAKRPAAEAASVIQATLRRMPGVYDVFTREELMRLPEDYPYAPETRRGIHPRRSGDLVFMLDPAWHPDDKLFTHGGTTHGSPYSYDTHVPLLWYGWRIPAGESFAPVQITDIAPTLAAMLRIMEPSGTTGKVIEELFKK